VEGRELAPFRNGAKRLVNSIPPRLARSTVQWGAISFTDIAGAQTTLHEQNVTASADHTFNRLTLKLSGTLADYNYDDVTDPTLVGPVPFLDIRYCTEAVGTLRSSRCSVPSGAILCSALMAPRGRRLCRRSGDRSANQGWLHHRILFHSGAVGLRALRAYSLHQHGRGKRLRRGRGAARREAQTLMGNPGSSDQLLDLRGQSFAQVRALERISDIGGEKTELRAAVEAAPFIF
jgi:hypothetical protein